jgi:hypothetical protein
MDTLISNFTAYASSVIAVQKFFFLHHDPIWYVTETVKYKYQDIQTKMFYTDYRFVTISFTYTAVKTFKLQHADIKRKTIMKEILQ